MHFECQICISRLYNLIGYQQTHNNMKKLNIFLIASIICIVSVNAQTIIPGNTDVSGTWTKTASPYVIQGEITIPPSQILSIESGVEVRFDGYYALTVEGQLIAAGIENDSVVFTRNSTEIRWKGLDFIDGTGRSELHYTVVEWAGTDDDDSDGSGIDCEDTDLLIIHSNIRHNNAYSGGGIKIWSSYPFLDGTIFSVLIINTQISYNRASYFSSVYCTPDNCTIILTNSIISENRGDNSHLNIGDSKCMISNCIFYNNRASDLPWTEEAYALLGGNCYVANSIFWKSKGISSSSYIQSDAVQYCLIEGGYDGVEILDSDPEFIDPDNGDFRLSATSPCINSGHPEAFFNNLDGTRNNLGHQGGSYVLPTELYYDFGSVGIGQEKKHDFCLFNLRNESIDITSASVSDNENFSVDESYPLTIPPYSVDTFSVTFHPTIKDSIQEEIVIHSSSFYGSSQAGISLFGEAGVFNGSVHGVWYYNNSPYIISGKVTVEDDNALIIRPGVEVLFREGASLDILDQATFEAKGTKDSVITFTSSSDTPEPGDWGGLYILGTDKRTKLKNCIIEYANTGIECRGRARGCGAIHNYSNIDSCVIRYNLNGIECYASGSSLGCTFPKTGISSPTVTHCRICENSESGIYLVAYDSYLSRGYVAATITNNIIRDNAGSGIECTGEEPVDPKIINNTIINNEENGIAYDSAFNSNDFQISNNIIAGNNIGISSLAGKPTYIQYNNIWSNTSGEYLGIDEPANNISLDPLFVEPSSHYYELQSSSPCIDSGNPLLADPDNTRSDIGAIFYKHMPAAYFEADTTSGHAPLTVRFTDNSVGVLTNWFWDFGDSITSIEQNPSHTYTEAGTYTVSLTVADSEFS